MEDGGEGVGTGRSAVATREQGNKSAAWCIGGDKITFYGGVKPRAHANDDANVRLEEDKVTTGDQDFAGS